MAINSLLFPHKPMMKTIGAILKFLLLIFCKLQFSYALSMTVSYSIDPCTHFASFAYDADNCKVKCFWICTYAKK